jgi:hypothetical protein
MARPEITPARRHDLQQNAPCAREKHSFQFALTGTGAFFGVLR